MRIFNYYINTYIVVFLAIFINCCTPLYIKMSKENPNEFINRQDSLLVKHGNSKLFLDALLNANTAVGESNFQKGKFTESKINFNKVIKMSKDNINAKYYLKLIEGQKLIATGNKNKIWDAIEIFSKASIFLPNRGEAYYYIAKSYTMIGDKDFDLIFEAYDKAISLKVNKDLRLKIEKEYEDVKIRKKRLDSFWK